MEATDWYSPIAQALAGIPQLHFAAEATGHPSLPKALRLMRTHGLSIDNSCFLYPVFERPLKDLLAALLVRDLSTARESLLPRNQAEAVAETLCKHVDPESTWLSNANWGQHTDGYWFPTGGWKPFTSHAFDAGFVWLAPDSIGYLWAWAEDLG